MADRSSVKEFDKLGFVNYEPVPFYFVNGDIERDEITRQLDIMRENGISAFFFHVRDGICGQAYGTDVFFENVKFTARQAAARGLKMWLYDEDAYPSGNLGGRLCMEHPEFAARSLTVEKIPSEKIPSGGGRVFKVLGEACGIAAYIVEGGGKDEKVRVLTDCFGPVRRHWYRRYVDKQYYFDMHDVKFKHIRANTCYSEMAFEADVPEGAEVYIAYLKEVKSSMRYGTQCDCLNRAATMRFIAETHEKYKAYVGEYFGSVIPGIFTDEPYTGGYLPYTGKLFAHFQKKYGYSLEKRLYKLCADYKGESAGVRKDYYECVSGMFRANFLQPVKRWCKKNNLILTGHFLGEEDLASQVYTGQNVYRNAQLMDIPGFDIIGNDLGDVKHPGLILGARIISSVSAQKGSKRTLAECFALNPYNFGYNGLKRIADWLFACGINMLVPHGFFYSYGAFARSDAGKSFFYQDPLFGEYLDFSGYAGRVCRILSDYKENCRVLLVLPYEELAAAGAAYSEGNIAYGKEIKALTDTVKKLSAAHVMWQVTDLTAARNSVRNGKAVIGGCSYDAVICPPGGEAEKILSGCGIKVFTDADGLTERYGLDLGKDGEDILVLKKTRGKKELCFLFNNSAEYKEAEIPSDKDLTVYDGEKDRYLSLPARCGKCSVGIKPFGSVIVLSGEKGTDGVYEKDVYTKGGHEYITAPQLTFMPEGAVYAITDYDINITGSKSAEVRGRFMRVRDIIGTQDAIYKDKYVIPYFDTAPRQPDIYPCSARYTAKITGRASFGDILFDGQTFAGSYKIYFNGEEIKSVKKVTVYDKYNYAFTPLWKEGENLFTVVFPEAGEFDGINGEVYIMQK